MAPTKNKPPGTRLNRDVSMVNELKKYFSKDFAYKLLFDPQYIGPVCMLLFLFEIVLNIFIIEKVKYTEIDWIAYMQEVEGFLNGTLDYSKLKGKIIHNFFLI